MADLRKDFKNWLLTVKKYKETTADRYIGRISSVYKKNFAINKHSMERDDWRILSENILLLLSKYYELSNKDYYVDRVTIIYALEYFNKISDFLYSANPAISDDIAKYIYLMVGMITFLSQRLLKPSLYIFILLTSISMKVHISLYPNIFSRQCLLRLLQNYLSCPKLFLQQIIKSWPYILSMTKKTPKIQKLCYQLIVISYTQYINLNMIIKITAY